MAAAVINSIAQTKENASLQVTNVTTIITAVINKTKDHAAKGVWLFPKYGIWNYEVERWNYGRIIWNGGIME